MKAYTIIYHGDLPFLRQKNPLAGTNVISAFAYAEHEKLYAEAAKLLINPVNGRIDYSENELQVLWRYKGDEIPGEPSYIDTLPEHYDQVFKVISTQQEQVHIWLQECFGDQVARDKAERAFRFMEEALELVQSVGLTREDISRCVAYTYDRPVGEVSQEIGGVAFTLSALCHAFGVTLTEALDEEIALNWSRKDTIIEKWKSKITVNPLN